MLRRDAGVSSRGSELDTELATAAAAAAADSLSAADYLTSAACPPAVA